VGVKDGRFVGLDVGIEVEVKYGRIVGLGVG
jgi:hypothetical protein